MEVTVAEGSLVEVRVGLLVGVRVHVRLGHRVSLGRTVGPVGVMLGDWVKVAVRVGGSGVAVKGMVALGKITFVAEGVALPVCSSKFPPWL